MPLILNAEDVAFLTGEQSKIMIDETLVLDYIRKAKKKARYERAIPKRAEYNKRYAARVAERIENDPEFYAHLKAKQAEYAQRRKLKAQQIKESKLKEREDREDREDREARGDD